ncbi:MAG: RNA 2',3'-cyclic phosphodiesterase [Deltaproteobacteria bacterium]|jgi:2'-5' RNA ligase|nr:RNA 2',3'-cyclic phosphodiesterase [Deltaproteobacteria bacterium]
MPDSPSGQGGPSGQDPSLSPGLRSFLAIDVPKEVSKGLAALLPKIKLTAGGQLHLTLRFLGNVPMEKLELLMAEAALIKSPPFPLTVNGLGFFRQASSRAVLWAGLAPSPRLFSLKTAVDAALAKSLGLSPDKRFKPHVTLARVKESEIDLRSLVEQFRADSLPKFPAGELKLYKSELRPQGAVHTVLGAWPLV